jgi:hypothetical protein
MQTQAIQPNMQTFVLSLLKVSYVFYCWTNRIELINEYLHRRPWIHTGPHANKGWTTQYAKSWDRVLLLFLFLFLVYFKSCHIIPTGPNTGFQLAMCKMDTRGIVTPPISCYPPIMAKFPGIYPIGKDSIIYHSHLHPNHVTPNINKVNCVWQVLTLHTCSVSRYQPYITHGVSIPPKTPHTSPYPMNWVNTIGTKETIWLIWWYWQWIYIFGFFYFWTMFFNKKFKKELFTPELTLWLSDALRYHVWYLHNNTLGKPPRRARLQSIFRLDDLRFRFY